jgi:DNA polymerase I-like protein with 3'-5' exonuclease and polymerase domains
MGRNRSRSGNMQIITIDFETYYDKKYSLSKLTTEEYVRDERFEVIGFCIKQGDGEEEWHTGGFEDLKRILLSYNWEESFCLAHNTMFDAAILSWKFGVRPRGWLDTLSMARALHGTEVGGSLKKLSEFYNIGQKGTEVENAIGKRLVDFREDELARYAEYCKQDVRLTKKLFELMSQGFPAVEFRLIDLTINMFSQPVLELDLAILENHLENVVLQKEKLLESCIADKETLMSNPKFAEKLKSLGVEPPMKISPRTGKETFAFSKTDEGFKKLQEHPNEKVQTLVAARLGTKSTLEETRTQRFLDIGNRGSLPVPLKYYAAHTGRWGGSDNVNLQNIPRKSVLKEAIQAPGGFVVVNSDSSQIEARVLAWLSGQEDLVQAFANGDDVYKIMASAIYGRPVEDIDSEQRFVGKTTILGCGYGMGAKKFSVQLKAFGKDLDVEECKKIIQTYRKVYPFIPNFWRKAQAGLEAIIKGRYIEVTKQKQALGVIPNIGFDLPNGLQLKYPDLKKEQDSSGEYYFSYKSKKDRINIYGGKVVENICQAVARCVIGEQMLRVAKKYKVVMTVHDAVTCIAPEQEAEEAAAYVTKCMKWKPDWCQDLPLDCETECGESYG